MKKLITGSVFVCSLAVAVALIASPGIAVAGGDGKAVFEAQKCAQCHGVKSLGIEPKTSSAAMQGADLSEVTLDAEFLAKYLRKQEQQDGKDHKKEVKIDDAEMTALIEWLRAPKS